MLKEEEETLGRRGHSKVHRPDVNQIVVSVILYNNGNPVCYDMWPKNTAGVKGLISIAERTRSHFSIGGFCVVSDRGMISYAKQAWLDKEHIPYILEARMRRIRKKDRERSLRERKLQEGLPGSCSSQRFFSLRG